MICTVKRIMPHSAFVSLDEYEGKEAMLHISEVSSKWVKSIRDFISESKKMVCKVLHKNVEKGYVDVSLKRVSNVEAQRKMNDLKTEVRVEKLLEIIAKKLGEDPKKALDNIGPKIIQEYDTLAEFYAAVRADLSLVDELKIPEKWKTELKLQVTEQIKAQRVTLSKDISASSTASDGVDRVKALFRKMAETGKSKGVEMDIKYLSAPKYRLDIVASDYKSGESFLKRLFEQSKAIAEKSSVSFSVAE